jgi:FHA domain-containing protein
LGILNEFERRLEGAIEGVFTKAFRTGLHPVELANRIVREMDTNKTVGVREVWVPNRYEFRLSPVDRDRFAKTEKALQRELEQVVREGAHERGWGLVGPAEVLFATDEGLKQGHFTCESSLVEGAPSSSPSAGGGVAGQAADVEGGRHETLHAELVVIENNRPGKAYALMKERVVIGRLADSDVVVPDPGVSRRHAEVRRENGGFVLADLGSTNGTIVNGTMIGERALEEGDRIKVGNTILEFRRR